MMLPVILINKDATSRMFVLMFVWNKFISMVSSKDTLLCIINKFRSLHI